MGGLVGNSPSSCYTSALKCVEIIRRRYILISFGSEPVKTEFLKGSLSIKIVYDYYYLLVLFHVTEYVLDNHDLVIILQNIKIHESTAQQILLGWLHFKSFICM